KYKNDCLGVGNNERELGIGEFWHKFLIETNSNDNIDYKNNDEIINPIEHDVIPKSKNIVIFTVGIVGIGKSTIGNRLADKFKDRNIITLEQDTFAKYGKKSGKKTHDAFIKLLQQNTEI